MKKTTDLLVYELNRIKYGYLLLISLVTVLQVAAVFQTSRTYQDRFLGFQRQTQGNMLDFLETWGPLSYLQVTNHPFFYFSIFLGIMGLVFYSFSIWYRDWWGKNNLSYRLLSLPGSRMSIFYAKFLTILFMIAGLLVLQLLYLKLGNALLQIVTPAELFEQSSIQEAVMFDPILFIILPPTLIDFILHYSIGIAALATVFMMVILEISFKLKGILMSGLLVAAGSGIFMLMRHFETFNYLFPMEIVLLGIGLSVLLFIFAQFVSHKLMQTKITV